MRYERFGLLALISFALGSAVGLHLTTMRNARHEQGAPRSCPTARSTLSELASIDAVQAAATPAHASIEDKLQAAAAHTALLFPMFKRLVFIAESNYGFVSARAAMCLHSAKR